MGPSRRDALRLLGCASLALAGCAEHPLSADRDGEPRGDRAERAFGGDRSDGRGNDGDHLEPGETAAVRMTTTDDGAQFQPRVVRIEVGGTVNWQLDRGSHSTTAYHPDSGRSRRVPDGGGGWDSGVLHRSGATFARSFGTPGVHDYRCRLHEEAGMVGSVVVGDPDPDGQPGLAPPQESLPAAARRRLASLEGTVRAALDAD